MRIKNRLFNNRFRSKYKAFTLIELLIVVAIIGILATVIVVSINGAQTKAKDAKVKSDLVQISKLATIYFNENNTYAPLNCSSAGTKCDAINDGGNNYLSQIKTLAGDVKTVSQDNSELTIIANATSYQAFSALPSSSAKSIVFSDKDSPSVSDIPVLGLVGYWPMDGIAGMLMPDLSGSLNRGLVVGALSESDSATDQKRSSVLRFDGIDDYVKIDNSTSLKVTRDLTIAMWLKPATRVAGKRENPINKAYGGEYTMTFESSHNMNFYYGTYGGDGGTFTQLNSGPNSIGDNAWIHIAVTRNFDTGKTTWYINGVKKTETSIPYSAATASNNDVKLGQGYAGSYTGLMDEVRIYNRALNQTEITNLFSGT